MNFSSATIIACFLGAGISAFAPQQQSSVQSRSHSTLLNMVATIDFDSDSDIDTRPVYDPFRLYPDDCDERIQGRLQVLEPNNIQTKKPILDPFRLYSNSQSIDTNVDMSDSLPFLPRPLLLDRTMPGDVGFDPFNLSGDSEQTLYNMREAEIKHSRLAMLAAIGWPLSELYDKPLAHMLHLPALLGHGDKVPSLLNGGLETISPLYWISIVAIAGVIETFSSNRQMEKEMRLPGDLGFDPLRLYPKDETDQHKMQLAEIKHGRLAMIAITGFAAQELFTNMAVIHQM
jgi:Chlorophyll A-B binding protein